jgi:hypothetical protein
MANLPSDGSLPDHSGWMAEEIPFNDAQRTWERADITVCGSPEIPYEGISSYLWRKWRCSIVTSEYLSLRHIRGHIRGT